MGTAVGGKHSEMPGGEVRGWETRTWVANHVRRGGGGIRGKKKAQKKIREEEA